MKPIRPTVPVFLSIALAGALVAACTDSGASPSAAPSASALASTEASAEPTPDPCATESLATKESGTLTVGTDNPAFPPYFDTPKSGEPKTDPWELGDPTNGRGFESAFTYALADELGFGEDEVAWTVVRWNQSFAPGPKAFDIYIGQISYKPARATNADLSDAYYFLNQALVARAGTPIASATTLAEVRQYKLGVAIGSTSLDYITEVIQPDQEPRIYDDNDGAIAGLNADQVAGIVVDLPAAFYITSAQMADGVIVGQFPPTGAEQEHYSVVMDLDSPLTDCVNAAIGAMKANGELDAVTQKWMADKANAPLISE